MCDPVNSCGECPYCRREEAQETVDEIMEYLQTRSAEVGREMDRFITLTLPDDDQFGDGFEAQASEITERVRELTKEIESNYGPVDWIGSIEPHSDGSAHAHLLLDRYIDKKHLEAMWRAEGGGFVDIRRATGGPAEVAKYITVSTSSPSLIINNIPSLSP